MTPNAQLDITGPYNDMGSGQNCTIGYGEYLHAGPCTGGETDSITISEAEARFRVKLQAYATPVRQGTHRGLTQAQFDALVDFSYNAGPGDELSKVLNMLIR